MEAVACKQSLFRQHMNSMRYFSREREAILKQLMQHACEQSNHLRKYGACSSTKLAAVSHGQPGSCSAQTWVSLKGYTLGDIQSNFIQKYD